MEEIVMIKLSNTISEILEYNGFSYNEVEERTGWKILHSTE